MRAFFLFMLRLIFSDGSMCIDILPVIPITVNMLDKGKAICSL
jgi:hypothetical protein